MTAPAEHHGSPHALAYASASRGSVRRHSVLAVVVFLLALIVAPAGVLLAALAMQRNVIPHDMLCPSCGGWGATVAVVAMGALLVGSMIVLVRTIRLPGRAGSILLAAVATVLAAVQTFLAVGFYFVIQM